MAVWADRYLNSSYHPDVEYVDGPLVGRGMPTIAHALPSITRGRTARSRHIPRSHARGMRSGAGAKSGFLGCIENALASGGAHLCSPCHPFCALANVLLRNEKQDQAMAMSAELASVLDPAPEGIKVLGPAGAPVNKLKNEYRYQLLIKAVSRKQLNELLQRLRRFALDRKWSSVSLVIDVDPLSLL